MENQQLFDGIIDITRFDGVEVPQLNSKNIVQIQKYGSIWKPQTAKF